MKPSEIKTFCVYDYRPPRAQGAYPCVFVDEITDGQVFYRWLEEDGGFGEISLKTFAQRCTSRRHKRTWARIRP